MAFIDNDVAYPLVRVAMSSRLASDGSSAMSTVPVSLRRDGLAEAGWCDEQPVVVGEESSDRGALLGGQFGGERGVDLLIGVPHGIDGPNGGHRRLAELTTTGHLSVTPRRWRYSSTVEGGPARWLTAVQAIDDAF